MGIVVTYWLDRPTWQPTTEEYFASPYLGSGAAAAFAANREKFRASAGRKEQTEAMLRGSVLDCAVTEPDQFASRYALETDAMKAAVVLGLAGQELVKPTVLEKAASSYAALWRNAQACSLFGRPGLSQVCHHWTHTSGIELRMRLDRATMLAKGPVIVDLKNWEINPDRLPDEIARRGIDRQMAQYHQGFQDLWPEICAEWRTADFDPPHVILVVVPPSGEWVRTRPMDPEFLRLGKLDLDADFEAMMECNRTGDWSNPEDHSLEYVRAPWWRVIQSERRHGG